MINILKKYIYIYLIFFIVLILYYNNNNINFVNFILLTLLLILTFILTEYFNTNNIFSMLILIFLLIIYFYIININLKMNNFLKNICIENNVREKKNIKVALCLTGRIDDNIEKIYYNLKKNLLDHYDIDIFINADREDDLIKKLYNPKKYIR